MFKSVPFAKLLPTLALFFFSFLSYSQLPEFNVVATPTPQTCLGNGALSFTVTGVDPAATISYEVYLLPDTTSPLTVVTNPVVNNLFAGTYLVVATQSLGAQSNQSSYQAIITNQVVPIVFDNPDFDRVRCGNDGTITVNMVSGNITGYELTGPTNKPLQTSNIFTGLSAGLYLIKVYDNCGGTTTQNFTLTTAQTSINIDPIEVDASELPSCNTINISHFFATTGTNEIFFPLTFRLTVYPPGGGSPLVVTQNVPSGTDDDNTFLQEIPFYHAQEYSYDLQITDACGNIFTRNNNIVNEQLGIGASAIRAGCEDLTFTVTANTYVAPYTLEFINPPAGFNPSDFNEDYPTFSQGESTYGEEGNPVPEGDYTIKITDNCGRTVTQTFEIILPPVVPVVTPEVEGGCAPTGSISVEVPTRDVVTVIINVAPPTFTETLPFDASAFIVDGIFLMENLPLGEYTLHIKDSCDDEYDEDTELESTGTTPTLTSAQRPGCGAGVGSLRLSSSVALTSVKIVGAPPTFTETLPFDVSVNIDGSNFYMGSLPIGTYTFDVVGDCGLTGTRIVTLTDYQVSVNDVNVIPYCGSFDIELHHTSTNNTNVSFWLQKYNSVTSTWGHPGTGVAYTEGTLPSVANSINLLNNSTTINLGYSGSFRVLKVFYTYGDKVSSYRCTEVIKTFTLEDRPEITKVYSFPCSNGTNEVVVEVFGVPPFTYRIIKKNTADFIVNNGNSNVFANLETATYTFEVTDSCGNARTAAFAINGLDPVSITPTGFCEGEDSSLSVQPYSFLNYQWWKEGSPGTILSTSSVLSFPSYNSATDAGNYIVSITSNFAGSCLNQTLEFSLLTNSLPNAGGDGSDVLCNDGSTLNLMSYLVAPFDAGGSWEDLDASGALTGSLFNTTGVAAGTYQFRYKVTGICSSEDTAIVTIELNDIPQAIVPNPVISICEGSDINLAVNTVAGATYEWSGPDNFTSAIQNPSIIAAGVSATGIYTVTITSNGCTATATVDVTIDTLVNAGGDNSAEICNDGVSIDLASYLVVPFDTGGTWDDVDASGGLTGSTFNINGVAQGIYQFKYTVTGACNVDDAFITIELKNIPSAPVPAPVSPVCEGTDVQLGVTAIPGASYQWTGPSGFSSTDQNPLLAGAGVQATGEYFVTATIDGCTSPASSVTVTVNPYPQFSIQGSTSICIGQTIQLAITGTNLPASAVWYHDDSIMPGVTALVIDVTEPGVYKAELTNGNCTSAESITLLENTSAFTIDIEEGCRDFEYVLSVANLSEIDFVSIEWTGPAGYFYAGEEAVITDKETGDYKVVITNAEGCTAEAIIPIDNTRCWIPRGISPNNDSRNDSFDLAYLNVRHLKIFNRYGLKVYEKDNYVNEWHGQSDKGDLPTGTYYYMLTLSEGKEVTGWVYLQREVN